jgi:glycosyltransferase involved in cell wall biosynthesis
MTADAVGGVWTYALELARDLSRRGAMVALAVMGPEPSPAQRREAAAIAGLEFHVGAYRLEWMDNPWAEVSDAGEWLLELARRLRPDIVHLNGYAHATLAWPAPVLVVAHSCVLSWWEAVKGEAAPGAWCRYREAVRRGLLAADFVVAPTAAMLAAIRRHYGVEVEGQVIPNGISPGDFALGAKEPFVFAAGRLWDEAKNLAVLDRAARRIAWPVRVAGDDRHPNGARLRMQAVETFGFIPRPELCALLARAAIYTLPARYEPFGLSALEAAASGCALVLGDIPSLREVWGDAALYVAPGDDAALAAALDGLICDPAALARLADRGRERAGRYTSEAMTQAYVDLYGTLLGRSAPALKQPA